MGGHWNRKLLVPLGTLCMAAMLVGTAVYNEMGSEEHEHLKATKQREMNELRARLASRGKAHSWVSNHLNRFSEYFLASRSQIDPWHLNRRHHNNSSQWMKECSVRMLADAQAGCPFGTILIRPKGNLGSQAGAISSAYFLGCLTGRIVMVDWQQDISRYMKDTLDFGASYVQMGDSSAIKSHQATIREFFWKSSEIGLEDIRCHAPWEASAIARAVSSLKQGASSATLPLGASAAFDFKQIVCLPWTQAPWVNKHDQWIIESSEAFAKAVFANPSFFMQTRRVFQPRSVLRQLLPSLFVPSDAVDEIVGAVSSKYSFSRTCGPHISIYIRAQDVGLGSDGNPSVGTNASQISVQDFSHRVQQWVQCSLNRDFIEEAAQAWEFNGCGTWPSERQGLMTGEYVTMHGDRTPSDTQTSKLEGQEPLAGLTVYLATDHPAVLGIASSIVEQAGGNVAKRSHSRASGAPLGGIGISKYDVADATLAAHAAGKVLPASSSMSSLIAAGFGNDPDSHDAVVWTIGHGGKCMRSPKDDGYCLQAASQDQMRLRTDLGMPKPEPEGIVSGSCWRRIQYEGIFDAEMSSPDLC